MGTTIKNLRNNYINHFGFGTDMGELFVRAFPGSVIRDYFLSAFAFGEGDDAIRTKATVKRLLGELKNYGCIDYILWFALFLSRYAEDNSALKEFYEILDSKELLGTPIAAWCDQFIEECSYEENEEQSAYALTSAFICHKMLGIEDEHTVEEMEQIVSDKVNEELSKYTTGTKEVHAAYAKAQSLGWLLHVYRRYDDTPSVCGYLLKKLFTELDATALPKTDVKIAILSSMLKAYTDASIVLTSCFRTYKTAGLGKAIADFEEDAEGKNKELLDYLRQEKPHELQALLCYAMCQATEEEDYTTSAKLFIRHFEYSRDGYRQQARHALLKTYLNVEDDVTVFSLYSIIKREQQRKYNAFTMMETSRIAEHFADTIQKFVKISQDNIEQIKCSALSEYERLAKLDEECERYKMVTDFFPTGEFFEKRLYQSMKKFLCENNLPDEDLLRHLGENEKHTVIRYLRQGELIASLFKMLEGDRGSEEMYHSMDYSPALISLTKSMEYIGNLMYKKISPQLLLQHNTYRNNNGSLKDNITLGNFQHFFSTGGNKNIYPLLTYANAANKDCNKTYLNDIVDISKYRGSITNSNTGPRQIFRDLKYLCDCRNNTAHKDPITPEVYENCDNYLFATYESQKYILWSILYMIKDDVVLRENNSTGNQNSH